MTKLSASFKLTPTFPLIVECKDDEAFCYNFFSGEFDVSVNISIMEYSPKRGVVGSDLYKRLADRVEIVVTKEVGIIPEVPLTERGGRDFTKVTSYFNDLKGGYQEVAQSYYKRIINYFKFELRQPFLETEYINDDELSNPVWFDSSGIDYGVVSLTHNVQPIPGMSRSCLGIETLKTEHANLVKKYIEKNNDTELFQQILSDAQAAILSGDLRRATFELAVVCELSTKRKYFAENGISGLAFDYFEDKGKVKVTVIELITKVASEVLGESFQTFSQEDYKNIDYLFRCRNKVAHRGQIMFKDDSGNVTIPDQECLEAWYSSVSTLLKWLLSK